MKTTTIPHVLEQLSIDLVAHGVKFDTALGYGVKVNLGVRYEPMSAKNETPHVVVERVILAEYRVLCGDDFSVQVDAGTNVFHLIPRSQVEAIEENLLAQMSQ